MSLLTGLVHRGAFWHQIEKAPIILGLFRQEHSRILSFPRKFAYVFSWANEKKDFYPNSIFSQRKKDEEVPPRGRPAGRRSGRLQQGRTEAR
jgi:hypothetical protein